MIYTRFLSIIWLSVFWFLSLQNKTRLAQGVARGGHTNTKDIGHRLKQRRWKPLGTRGEVERSPVFTCFFPGCLSFYLDSQCSFEFWNLWCFHLFVILYYSWYSLLEMACTIRTFSRGFIMLYLYRFLLTSAVALQRGKQFISPKQSISTSQSKSLRPRLAWSGLSTIPQNHPITRITLALTSKTSKPLRPLRCFGSVFFRSLRCPGSAHWITVPRASSCAWRKVSARPGRQGSEDKVFWGEEDMFTGWARKSL